MARGIAPKTLPMQASGEFTIPPVGWLNWMPLKGRLTQPTFKIDFGFLTEF